MVKINSYIGGADPLGVEEVFRECLDKEMSNKSIDWDSNSVGDIMPDNIEITVTVVLKKTGKKNS